MTEQDGHAWRLIAGILGTACFALFIALIAVIAMLQEGVLCP